MECLILDAVCQCRKMFIPLMRDIQFVYTALYVTGQTTSKNKHAMLKYTLQRIYVKRYHEFWLHIYQCCVLFWLYIIKFWLKLSYWFKDYFICYKQCCLRHIIRLTLENISTRLTLHLNFIQIDVLLYVKWLFLFTFNSTK